jgi:WD40 repeat protein/serine/threonine protein kinase
LTDSSSDRDPFERLAEEFVDRHRRGETAMVEDYVERHPEWAERIREVFPALLMLEDLKPGSADATGSINGATTRRATIALERLGDFRILREVGRGGMGVVYEAVQESLGRHVALKVLPLQGRIDPVQIERFRLEARSAARLHHTHIVPVHGVGEFDGVHYYAMQFIQGHGLDVILDDLRRLRGEEFPSQVVGERTATQAQASLAVARSLLMGDGANSVPTVGLDGSGGADGDRVAQRNAPPRTPPYQGGEPNQGPAASTAANGGSSPASPLDKGGFGGVRTVPPHSQGLTHSHTAPISRSTDATYYRTVARIGVQVAEALAHAHAQGVLHRDIKPANLLLDADGSVWITDFGLAKLEGSDGPTRTGDIVGTLRYMAPERFEGWSDPRSDVYGLGITLYELLTLRPAFEAATRVALIERVVKDVPIPPRKVDARIPRDLETVVLKAIAKEPSERYATAHALADDLENFLAGRPIRARRSGLSERAWRWCRRNPTAAALSAVSAIAALALVAVGLGAHYNTRLNAALRNEETIRYFHNMLAAEREWSTSNVRRADQLLADCAPKPGRMDLRGWEWHYLKRKCHNERLSIPSRLTNTASVAFHPDGRTVASSSGVGGALEIWDVETRTPLERISVYDQPGTNAKGLLGGVAFSADGHTLAVANGSVFHAGEVTLWDWKSGRLMRILPGLIGALGSVAFSPRDGRLLAVASGELEQGSNGLAVWEVETGNRLWSVAEPGAEGVLTVAFSPDGKSITAAIGARDPERPDDTPSFARIYDSRTGKVLHTLAGYAKPLTSVAFSPDGTRLATTSTDLRVRVWDIDKEKELFSFQAHDLPPIKVAYNPDGQTLATASDDSSIRIWDATTGRRIATLHGHEREVVDIAYSRDGKHLASASQDQTIKIWDTTPKGEDPLLTRHTKRVTGVAYSPDGRLIASASDDKTIRVCDAESGRVILTPTGHNQPIWDVAFSPDGKWIATASGDWRDLKASGEARIWNARDGTLFHTLRGHVAVMFALAFSPDSTRLVTVGDEAHLPGTAIVWDVVTGRPLTTLRGPTTGLRSVAYSPDGKFIAAGAWHATEAERLKTVWVWDASTYRLVRTMANHTDHVRGLAFSPRGDLLATASADGTVRLWDLSTGPELVSLLGHRGIVSSVAFSPDGKRLVTGGDDCTLKIWDTTTGQEILTIRGHTASVSRVVFSPDGTRIVSCSRDGTVKAWDGRP